MQVIETHVKNHKHQHSELCGHTKIQHEGHIDYLHKGHLHHQQGSDWDECVIPIDAEHPDKDKKIVSGCLHNDDCGHEKIPHGDHFDYLVNGRLEHVHNGKIYDHGQVEVVGSVHEQSGH